MGARLLPTSNLSLSYLQFYFISSFLLHVCHKSIIYIWSSQLALVVLNLPANAGDIRDAGLIPQVGKIPLGLGMAIHFSIIAWRIPWTKESSGLQSIASQVVGHDLKKLRLHTCPNITSQGLCHIHQFKKLISMPTRRCGTCIQWNITVIKKKEVMPFATTWMDLEIGNLSKTNQKKTNIT